jgi:broad specificity phosphatase PhoE
MISIIFESHATSTDNEKHISSGHNDVELSELGKRQAQELGQRYKDEKIDAIFCSDLQRSYKTADIAFMNRNMLIIKDARLRECDYGDLTQYPSSEVDPKKIKHISIPFPNGESYNDTSNRMKSFLEYLQKNYDGKKIMIIGHRATQYGLEHWINRIPLKDTITTTWTWQPGWVYILNKLM